MKKIVATLAFCTASLAQAADFTGVYAPANWTTTVDGNGSVLTSPSFIAITSPSDVAAGGYSRFTIAAPASGLVSFDWNFFSVDDPQYEIFGYLLNGLYTAVTSTSGAMQSGTSSFVVSAGDTFGFASYAVDNLGGTATTYVHNLSAPVPEPGTLALWTVGGGLLVASVRRRRTPA